MATFGQMPGINKRRESIAAQAARLAKAGGERPRPAAVLAPIPVAILVAILMTTLAVCPLPAAERGTTEKQLNEVREQIGKLQKNIASQTTERDALAARLRD